MMFMNRHEGFHENCAECIAFNEDLKKMSHYIHDPISVFNLDEDQLQFLKDNEINLSGAYIGMLRVYHENRTVFQTSAFKPMMATMGGGPLYDFDAIEKDFIGWLNIAMNADESKLKEILYSNLPLF